ncbi:CopD family protein [Allobranchiibius sp. GilTou38]|uniref:copper resistance D family protein n=1 Tax=Allobranchiibius sp. GilTou38 TaxID=2815210 RepID=UPI001AA1C7F3|nr:CopD family protein [Allobranchiibius sp. GilTou38]MBO1766988.1 CopD family protein [Allobranchiibius sp. GilTou38]
MTEIAAAATPYVAPKLWRVLTEVGYFGALCALIGGLVTVLLVVLPAAAGDEDGGATSADHGARRRALGMFPLIGLLMLAALYLQMAALTARAGEFGFGRGLQPGAIGDFLSTPRESGEWIARSMLRSLQVALLAGGAALAIVAGRLRSVRWAAVALLVAVVGELAPSVPTAFGGLTVDDWLHTTLVQVHILSGVCWVGGLGVLAHLAIRSRGEGSGLAWAQIWSRFSVLAMGCAGGILVSGLWLAWEHVGSFAQFVTTPYGRFLLAKVALVGLMLLAGAYNQLVLLPRVTRAMREHDETRVGRAVFDHFPRVAVAETLLGLGVLVVVPFLAGSARSEAGGGQVRPLDGRTFLIGVLLVAAMLLSFWATGRIARAQAQRPHVQADRPTVSAGPTGE